MLRNNRQILYPLLLLAIGALLGYGLLQATSATAASRSVFELASPAPLRPTAALSGTLTIIKEANPEGPTVFPFTLYSGSIGSTVLITFELVDDGTGVSDTISYDLIAGTYAIVEDHPPGWIFPESSCTSGSTSGFQIIGGGHVTCTFLNRLPFIKVIKEADPETDQVFNFDYEYFPVFDGSGSGTFDLIDDGTDVSNTHLITDFVFEVSLTYTIAENVPDGWRLVQDPSCVADELPNGMQFPSTLFAQESAAAARDYVTVSVHYGGQYTCTFRNEVLPATIIVTKNVVGQAPGSDWNFVGDPGIVAFTLPAAGGSEVITGLVPGAYTITETTKPGYDVSYKCSDLQEGTDNSVSLTMGPGVTESCVFTNTGLPGIILTKTVGTDPSTCATTDVISVPKGTTVYYCYTVENTGNISLTLHSLVDSERSGSILSGFSHDLGPGDSVNTVSKGTTVSATIDVTTTNIATWTALVAEGGPSVSATDTATVNLTPLGITLRKTVGVAGNTPSCPSTSVISVETDTVVEYCYTVTNSGDYTLSVHSLIDDHLGAILTDFGADLAPGASISTFDLGEVITATIPTTTTNVATWTASITDTSAPINTSAAEADPVQATATATVNVEPDAPTALNEADQPPMPARIFVPAINRPD